MATVSIGPASATPLAFAVVNSTSSSISTPAGTQGKIIKVYRLFLVVGAATNITFQDGANPQSGPLPLVANEAIVLDIDGTPWFITSPGNAFIIANSSSAQVSGTVYYSLDNP